MVWLFFFAFWSYCGLADWVGESYSAKMQTVDDALISVKIYKWILIYAWYILAKTNDYNNWAYSMKSMSGRLDVLTSDILVIFKA